MVSLRMSNHIVAPLAFAYGLRCYVDNEPSRATVVMEREIIFTGIGGQGIQLMAKVLAQAAAGDGKQVMLFGVYGGAMRGSASESTLVIGDEAIQAPPII